MPLLDIYALTKNPLILDAIRAVHDPMTPDAIRQSAQQFLEAQKTAYLILFPDRGSNVDHGEPTSTPGLG